MFNKNIELTTAILQKLANTNGSFATLLGDIEIELIQAHNYQHTKIFANRFWGDCGFIYVCFDFINMQGLLKHINKNGYACTEDSQNCFAMEDAALLELVETHKVPIEKNYIGICI